jgi:hypothetical protein
VFEVVRSIVQDSYVQCEKFWCFFRDHFARWTYHHEQLLTAMVVVAVVFFVIVAIVIYLVFEGPVQSGLGSNRNCNQFHDIPKLYTTGPNRMKLVHCSSTQLDYWL